MKLFAVLITATFLLSIYSGCKSEIPRQQHTAKTKVTQPKKLKKKSEAMVQKEPDFEEENYTYEPKGRRDPFVPLIEIAKKQPKGKRIAGTLESYDITDFRLLAIAEKEEQRSALLLAPDNKSYTVREGTVLGLHRGKVKEVASNRVVLLEHIKDYKGELKPREVVLELHKGEVEE